MLTDIFFKRYSTPILYSGNVPPRCERFFAQAAHIIFSDLTEALELKDGFFLNINNLLSREVGVSSLIGTGRLKESFGFLTEPYDLWDDAHGSSDVFIKLRFSFIELVFRRADEMAIAVKNESPSLSWGRQSRTIGAQTDRDAWSVALRGFTEELNTRLREAGLPLHYHNGFIQISEDDLSESEIREPFWDVVRDEKWVNVDRDIKEAIDRRDTGGRDPAGYAMRGLESAIKIISDQKGWTTGNEKGASNFIENLQAKRNGNFIANWEAEILRQMFREIRNPVVHGEGTAAPLQLSPHQTNWVIESCMMWIKSLLRRA